MMSSASSMPMESRTTFGAAPAAFCCSSVNCRCVVDAEWMISERVSPRLATWLKSSRRIHQFHAGLITAFHRESEQGPRALRVELRRPVCVGRRGETGIGDVFDTVVLLQPFGDLLRVGDMPLHPQAQRLDPEKRVVRGLRVHRHAEIAQADGDGMEGEGQRTEGFVEFQPVIGGFGFGKRGELARGRPVETCPSRRCSRP